MICSIYQTQKCILVFINFEDHDFFLYNLFNNQAEDFTDTPFYAIVVHYIHSKSCQCLLTEEILNQMFMMFLEKIPSTFEDQDNKLINSKSTYTRKQSFIINNSNE